MNTEQSEMLEALEGMTAEDWDLLREATRISAIGLPDCPARTHFSRVHRMAERMQGICERRGRGVRVV